MLGAVDFSECTHAITWARVVYPSFERMFPTWDSIVRLLTNSSPAISPFVFPWAINTATSHSRALNALVGGSEERCNDWEYGGGNRLAARCRKASRTDVTSMLAASDSMTDAAASNSLSASAWRARPRYRRPSARWALHSTGRAPWLLEQFLAAQKAASASPERLSTARAFPRRSARRGTTGSPSLTEFLVFASRRSTIMSARSGSSRASASSALAYQHGRCPSVSDGASGSRTASSTCSARIS